MSFTLRMIYEHENSLYDEREKFVELEMQKILSQICTR